MKFLIRDDDTCGFTKVEELQKCYHNIWQKIPVCLSVTPFRIPGCVDCIPVSFYGKTTPVALKENIDLVDFIKEGLRKKNLDIALHGYHHIIDLSKKDYLRINELDPRIIGREYLMGNNLEIKTFLGKEYLESLLDYKISTFVPPGNSISKEGIKAIAKNKMNLIGSPSFWRYGTRPFHPSNFLNALKRFRWTKTNTSLKYPFIIDAHSHKEIAYYLLYPSTDLNALKAELDFCHSVNGVFILSTHYNAFHKKISSGETIGQALNEIIDYISGKNDVEYITYRELW